MKIINYYIGLFSIFAVFTLPIISHAETFNIGDQRKMYLECKGKGSPTVILIAGYKDRGDAAWDTPGPNNPLTVFSAVAKFTRVCLYDRPGTIKAKEPVGFLESRSDPVQQPISADN